VAVLVLKKNKARDKAVLQKTVHEAIEKITADGKIEGPKGPYIPHERRGAMTDATTQASKHNGYYHHPWR